MRIYKVWVKSTFQTEKCVEVQADDVELDSNGDELFWNFLDNSGGNDAVTVAAFPFGNVEFLVSA